MPLKAVLLDKNTLISHGNWNEPLQKFLQGLSQYGVTVIDIGKEVGDINETDCLMIADCEATVQQAKAWNVAVLGYRIYTHLDMIVEGFEEVDYYFLERVYRRFHHLPWTIMESERCILREMTMEDLDAIYELYKPEEITRYIDGLHENRDEEKEIIKVYIENMYRFYGYGMWVVIEKATGQLIGRAGLNHFEAGEQIQLELGYVIAQDKQKQGYATEVCRGILDYVKNELDFSAVYCLIQKENLASIHLAEKLGFAFEEGIVHNEKEIQLYVKRIVS